MYTCAWVLCCPPETIATLVISYACMLSLLSEVKVKSLGRVQLLATPWTAALQAPPSMGFSRQEYWSGVPLPSPQSLKSCPKICYLINCSSLGSSVHGIFQARILKWVAISFFRGYSWPKDWSCVFCIGRQIPYHWATWEAPSVWVPAFNSFGFSSRSELLDHTVILFLNYFPQ